MIRNRVDGFTNLNRNENPARISRILPGILTFINILVKLCIYPYITNHVICIALFGEQESRNLAKIPNHVEENP